MEIYGVPGFVLGLLSGAVLLTWLYNSTSGSILAVALWHGLFNFFTASEAGQGTIAMVMSIAVMAWAIGLVFLAKPESLSRTRKPITGHTLPGYTGT